MRGITADLFLFYLFCCNRVRYTGIFQPAQLPSLLYFGYVIGPYLLLNPFKACQLLWVYFGVMITFYLTSFFSDYIMNMRNISIACLFSIPIIFLLTKQKSIESRRIRLFQITEYLGKMTYGLYVYSGIVITLNLTVFHIKKPILQLLTESLILFPLAIISYKYFELPFLKLKEKWR